VALGAAAGAAPDLAPFTLLRPAGSGRSPSPLRFARGEERGGSRLAPGEEARGEGGASPPSVSPRCGEPPPPVGEERAGQGRDPVVAAVSSLWSL